MELTPLRCASRVVPFVIAALGLVSSSSQAQTIRGRLLDAQNGQPIDLGILVLLTLDEDTISLTATTPDGRFSLTAPAPGSYQLRASAFGYPEQQEGVFELGEGGRLDIEFRIASRPMELEDILVSTDQPTLNHPLVQNGFVERYRRGFGHFITPRDLERTVYRDTESLFHSIPGVGVVTSTRATVGGRLVRGVSTDRVLMRNAGGSCAPTVFLDGVRTQYRPATGERLSDMVHIGSLEAVEIYARPSQIPFEYGGPAGNNCGVIVFWTKR